MIRVLEYVCEIVGHDWEFYKKTTVSEIRSGGSRIRLSAKFKKCNRCGLDILISK